MGVLPLRDDSLRTKLWLPTPRHDDQFGVFGPKRVSFSESLARQTLHSIADDSIPNLARHHESKPRTWGNKGRKPNCQHEQEVIRRHPEPATHQVSVLRALADALVTSERHQNYF
jgi:hypothetical protein